MQTSTTATEPKTPTIEQACYVVTPQGRNSKFTAATVKAVGNLTVNVLTEDGYMLKFTKTTRKESGCATAYNPRWITFDTVWVRQCQENTRISREMGVLVEKITDVLKGRQCGDGTFRGIQADVDLLAAALAQVQQLSK